MRDVDARLAAFPARDERRADLHFTPHHADRDPAESGRRGDTADVADFLAGRIEERGARSGRLGRRGSQATQVTIDMTAEMHPCDGLLTRVAPFRVRDR